MYEMHLALFLKAGCDNYQVHALRWGCELRDRGLASPAKQTSIPHLGSFTEVCSVVSEGRTGLGKVGLAGLRRQGLG
jgi:hypothetical protein